MGFITRLLTVLILIGGVGLGGYIILGPAGLFEQPGTNPPETTPNSGSNETEGLASSPWKKSTLVVGIENQAAPHRNISPTVKSAVSYWEENADKGTYSPDFVVRPNATNPDIIVFYNNSISCSKSGSDAIGCAPVLTPETTASPPEHVGIEYRKGDNKQTVTNTVSHEFGHVLGLTHCEPPHWLMSGDCETELPAKTNLEDSDFAWRDTTISVYVETSNVSEQAESEEQIAHAISYLNNTENTPVEYPDNLTFVRVDSRWEADVTITMVESFSSGSGEQVVQYSRRGQNSDGDKDSEWITQSNIQILASSDVEAHGWYAGWSLSKSLSPTHTPEPFVDATYEERRSNWWK